MIQNMFKMDAQHDLLREAQENPKGILIDNTTRLQIANPEFFAAADSFAGLYKQTVKEQKPMLTEVTFMAGVSIVYFAIEKSDLEIEDYSEIISRVPTFFDLDRYNLEQLIPIQRLKRIFSLSCSGLDQHPELKDHVNEIKVHLDFDSVTENHLMASQIGAGLCAFYADRAYQGILNDAIRGPKKDYEVDWDEAFIEHFGN